MTETLHELRDAARGALAHDQGLDYYPVQFEEVPSSFMMEIAVYGLPVRMPHWSFGVRYIYSSFSTAWVIRGSSRSSSPAIRAAPTSRATTRFRKTRS